VLVGSNLSSVHNGIAYLKLLNFKHHPVTLKKHTKIAKILLPHNVSSITEYKEAENKIETDSEENPENLEKFISDYKISLSPDLKPEERRKLMNLWFEFRDIFSRHMRDIKTFQNYQVALIKKKSKYHQLHMPIQTPPGRGGGG